MNGALPSAAAETPERRAPAGPPPLPARLSVVIPCYNERPNVRPMVEKLSAALSGLAWEAIFVDDDSPDGTAQEVRALASRDPRIRCLRRINRRGLSSAVIEGALSSSAEFVAVIDGDLQHDETLIPAMLGLLENEAADIVIGSRYISGGTAEGLGGAGRHRLSRLGGRLAGLILRRRLTDPMSGFFALRRETFEALAPRLSGSGFKILLDLLLAGGEGLRVRELPYRFRPRHAGESKLDALVLVQFLGLLLDHLLHGLVPLRFLVFAAVGLIGVGVNLGVLGLLRLGGFAFEPAQSLATFAAMGANFWLNNTLTYRDQRLRGKRLWQGLLLFLAFSGLGAVAGVGIAQVLYEAHNSVSLSGLAGALIAVVWNYAIATTLVWRVR